MQKKHTCPWSADHSRRRCPDFRTAACITMHTMHNRLDAGECSCFVTTRYVEDQSKCNQDGQEAGLELTLSSSSGVSDDFCEAARLRMVCPRTGQPPWGLRLESTFFLQCFACFCSVEVSGSLAGCPAAACKHLGQSKTRGRER